MERFEKDLLQGEATLRVSIAALPNVELLGAAATEAVLAATAGADGWRRVVIPIESVTHAAGLSLRFTDAVEVLAPPELREEVIQRAGRVLALYAQSKGSEAAMPTAAI